MGTVPPTMPTGAVNVNCHVLGWIVPAKWATNCHIALGAVRAVRHVVDIMLVEKDLPIERHLRNPPLTGVERDGGTPPGERGSSEPAGSLEPTARSPISTKALSFVFFTYEALLFQALIASDRRDHDAKPA